MEVPETIYVSQKILFAEYSNDVASPILERGFPYVPHRPFIIKLDRSVPSLSILAFLKQL
jgi:hypothetical protein